MFLFFLKGLQPVEGHCCFFFFFSSDSSWFCIPLQYAFINPCRHLEILLLIYKSDYAHMNRGTKHNIPLVFENILRDYLYRAFRV